MKFLRRIDTNVVMSRSPSALPRPKIAPPQPALKPSPMAPIDEPVPMIVAPSVQKMRNTFMSLPPVRNFSPSRLPRLPKNPTPMTNAIHAMNPPRKSGMYFGSSMISFSYKV